MDIALDLINKYVRAELMILVPVLYILAKMIDKSKIDNSKIPVIIGVIGILLSGIYTFSTVSIPNWHGVLFAIFTSITQGILLAGGAVWGGIITTQCASMKNPSKNSSSNTKI